LRVQPTNTGFYATMADNGAVAEDSLVLLQFKQKRHPLL
jgi:hypothetical protein